jgi:hypothetical protein
MTAQRCGSCTWFAHYPHELDQATGKEYHECLFPLPFYLERFYTHEDLGRDCKTYEAVQP